MAAGNIENDSLIPVIDFEECGIHNKTVDSSALKRVGDKIKDAFHTTGFCYLKNTGVDVEFVQKYMTASKTFFDQPDEIKRKHVRDTKNNFGWVSVERERLNPERPGDLKEAFNYCPADDPGDWPSKEFQTGCQEMFSTCTSLSYRVLDALSLGLCLCDTFLREAHQLVGKSNNTTTLRTLYYPPLPADGLIKPGQIRLGEHSDYGSITLLFQDNIGGLEVNIPGKGFVPATPISGTVVVNIGDLMQRWTSDHLVATKHRVLIPEEELKKRTSRQSVVFFAHPDDDYVVKCLDGSNKYEPITGLDYLNYRFSVTY